MYNCKCLEKEKPKMATINDITNCSNSPCYGCTKRCVGCHSTCEQYNEWKKLVERARLNERKASLSACYDRKPKSVKRTKIYTRTTYR